MSINLLDYGVDVDNDYIINACDHCAPVIMGYTDDGDDYPALNVNGIFAYVGCWDVDDIDGDVGRSCTNCEGELSAYGVGYNCHIFVEQ